MIGWVDASSGASGDMLLGALAGSGVPLGVMAEAVEKVAPGQVRINEERVRRAGFAAVRCHVVLEDTADRRSWREVEQLLATAGLHEDVRSLAHDVFARLAEAESQVHGMTPEDVHLHEFGALGAISEVVGVCAGMVHLRLERLVVSKVSVGAGSVATEHGRLPVPPPAVVELLRGVPSSGGPVDLELCTPTGAALLTALADEWGDQPAMAVSRVGVGAGHQDPEEHANMLRLLVGVSEEVDPPGSPPAHGSAVLLETNVDDLNPRVWSVVLAALMEEGASDAWLTPIESKKGPPAHMLSVLVAGDRADAVRREIHRQTSTVGMRVQSVDEHELERETTTVELAGHMVSVKVARLGGEVFNVEPEFEDVAVAAAALGRSVKTVTAEAVVAARGSA